MNRGSEGCYSQGFEMLMSMCRYLLEGGVDVCIHTSIFRVSSQSNQAKGVDRAATAYLS